MLALLLGLLLQQKPLHVVVDSTVLRYLESIAETRKLEDARCLGGRFVSEDTMVVDAIYETPWLLKSASDSGAYFEWNKCPAGTVGWWHSHPWLLIKQWAVRYGHSPSYYCRLSDVDQQGKRFPIALISIRRGLSCFFYQQADGSYVEVPLKREQGPR